MGFLAGSYADVRRAALDGAAALLDAGRTRLRLVATDLEASAHALAVLLATALLAVALLLIGMVCAGAALLLWAEPAQRPALLVGLAVLTLGAGACLLRRLRLRSTAASPLFGATLDELALDRDALQRAASRA